jgi:hypothetical protein
MPKLDKKKIDAATDFKIEVREVPEWGGTVYLKTLSVAEGIDFQSAKESVHEEKVVALYLTFALCDEEGKRLYQASDTDSLCEKNPKVLLRLFYDALALNKMDEGSDQVREEKS